MSRAWIVTVLACAVVLTGGLSGCSNSSPEASPSPSTAAALPDGARSPALDYKPGSHESAVFERLQEFRMKQRQRFKDFMLAYLSSHGNVKFPRLAAMKANLMHWLVLDERDYKQLPVYMKVFEGTGPYRRLTAKPGFSYVSGTIFLPCKAAKLHASFETAFAYVGGWGAGKAGKAVDAGFQRSDAYDNYSLFILAQDFKQISKFPRFECGHPVDFKFYAKSDTELHLWAKGLTTNGRVEDVEAVLPHPASYGWPADGGEADGIVLKRMTTIGQADADESLPDGVAWNEDGSYFGHYAGEVHPRIRWSNLMVGRVDAKGNPTDVRPWGVDESNIALSVGLLNYPTDPRTILYTCTACPDESNAINLAGGKP
ncbi:MAG: hypothetical protein JO199_06230 [Candidatus Eremiobacteraeota bacterium]|nr:hypothetical protein [Candidatus Eremiobacteraeota bacterium]